jgi:hypothetical protein
MDISDSRRQIRAWAAVGVMTSEAIYDRFDQNTIDSPAFSTEELNALERNFETVSDNSGYVSKAAFATFVLSKGNLPLVLTEAAGILFDSLCYLSAAPLQTTSLPHDHLSLKGLKRALIWSFPNKALSAITTTAGYRERSPADHRRLIFQSLATSYQGRCPPFDLRFAKALAADNARDFPPGHRGGPVEDADVNFDDDGDEMYHDILDFLASTQPYVPPTYAEPCRDGFRDLATKFHREAPSLFELAIPMSRLKAFLSLLLATNIKNQVVDCTVDADLELQSVAQSMEACFHQSLEAQASSSPTGCSSEPFDGSTWPMFNFAISRLLVRSVYHSTHYTLLTSVASPLRITLQSTVLGFLRSTLPV